MPGLQLLLACFLLLVDHIFGHARYRFREYNYRPRENNYRSRANDYLSRESRENDYRSREHEFQPNSIEQQSCPRHFRCIVEKWCRPEALESIRGEPQTCGYSNDWKERICCPLRTPRKPLIGTPASRTPSISGRNDDKDCGRSKAKPARRGYVVGGIHAKQGAWPWMVAIVKKNIIGKPLVCTGFLIDRQHVLTAAHCFEDGWKRKDYSVMFGHVDLTKGKEYNIRRVKLHPGYKKETFYDDIALLTLTSPVQDNNFNPICLPWNRKFKDVTGLGTSIAGWGITASGKTSVMLMELNGFPVVSNQKCSQALIKGVTTYQRDFPEGITKTLLCAGGKEGKDSCPGDSGGPLMFEYKGQWYAIGIVAFGFGNYCGTTGLPGGYTKVSEYLDWINENRNDV